MLTLLWGLPGDEPLTAVSDALSDRGIPAVLLDQRQTLATQIELADVNPLRGSLCFDETRIRLEDVTACYIRPYDSRRVPDIAAAGNGSREWRHALELEDALLQWLEMTTAAVVNRPSAMLPNQSKPFQLGLIAQFGFAIPETLVTTDPQEAESFWLRHKEVIYKSVSGERSRVARLTPAHKQRLGDLAHCPTQFQQYIRGSDFRAHVVGSEVFGCRIVSEADDYRYPGGVQKPPGIFAARLPAGVEERAVSMTRAMGLHVAGIDLRCTLDDVWYCFEMNPSPAFTFYERYTGQPIAAAIARFLSSPPGSRGHRILKTSEENAYDS